MTKDRNVYICDNCSFESPKWLGQCPRCLKWNTFVETLMPSVNSKAKGGMARTITTPSALTVLNDVKSKDTVRKSSKLDEFDRVLGGGFVPGQVILLSGEPGIGKSTVLLQVASLFEQNVIYICGEESPEQVRLRATRLGISGKNIQLLNELDVDKVIFTLDNQASKAEGLIIVDSIQSLTTSDLAGTSGSAGQVRECAQRLVTFAKSYGIPLILVGHITKDGSIAGPKVLEHMVDTVLYIEGDNEHFFRFLRTSKNRFGPISEVGIFEMAEKGLKEVLNPSDVFLEERLKSASGSCVTAIMEGYRPILFEVQALTSRTNFGYPKRTSSGFSANRLAVLVAVLEKRCALNLNDQDVYINIAGGVRVSEYSSDLAVCLAIYSSLKNSSVNPKVVAFGEVGLSGEVRKVPFMENRIKESKKLGFTKVISPTEARSVKDAIDLVFSK